MNIPSRITDLTGKVFGEMTVLAFAGYSSPKKGRQRATWLIKCFCGKEKVMLGTTLRNTKVKSCGHQRGFRLLPDGQAAVNLRVHQYRNNAIKFGREFSLDFDQFKKLLLGACNYCGAPPSSVVKARGKYQNDFLYNGVDRVDNEEGYTEANSVSCCGTCNMMKRAMSVQEFLGHIKRICDFQQSREDDCPKGK
jgi:hypothetical protein